VERLLAEGRRLWVVSDSTVAHLYGGPLVGALQARGGDAHLVSFPAGERHKTLRALDAVAWQCLQVGASREDLVVALGGGVTGDLAGLLAATLLRGVRWAQVPTTLLAQVDSSVGGKVAVNHALGKNLLGAFYPPEWAWLDAAYLDTLPPRQLAAGCAELVKHALLGDVALLEDLEALARAPRVASALSPSLLRRGVAVKAAVVSRDERERGERVTLNLGHTLGHALEAASRDLLHGEAVALGLCFALERSVARGLPPADAARAVALLRALGLPTDWRAALSAESLDFLRRDKKRSGEQLTFVVLTALGAPALERVGVEDLCDAARAAALRPPPF